MQNPKHPSFNRVELIGQLVTQPELKMVDIRKATRERIEKHDMRGGVFKHELAIVNAMIEMTDYNRVTKRQTTRAWCKWVGRSAEKVKFSKLKRGDRIFLTGRLSSYTTVKGGLRAYMLQIQVKDWIPLWAPPKRKKGQFVEVNAEDYERLVAASGTLESDDFFDMDVEAANNILTE